MKTYEAMLLVEPTIAAKEWARVPEEVDRIVKRHGAAVLSVVKFGERKLAFPVKKSNRGAYVVAYFSSPEKVLGKIKADFQLSEVVMRSLILAHEGELGKESPRDFETAGPLPKAQMLPVLSTVQPPLPSPVRTSPRALSRPAV